MFLPFAGCPGRCLYCQQERQTGATAGSLDAAYDVLAQALRAAPAEETWDELAFYGGSFTALPRAWVARFLALAQEWKGRGRFRMIRCSTRPDAVAPESLAVWAAMGLDVVELGVQSFQDAALAASGRHYDAACARRACMAIRQAGLGLGVQLMPGLPGALPGDLQRDVAEALALEPDGLRLYPCLVLEGTGLATLWRQGKYRPPALQATAWGLARALLRCWEAGVPVWRMGMLDQPGLQGHILAGPMHPALGTMAKARAIFLWIRQRLREGAGPCGEADRRIKVLTLPRRVSGEFWGVGRELAPAYARLGVTRDRVAWHDEQCMELTA